MDKLPRFMFCVLLFVFTFVTVQGRKEVRRSPQILRALPKLRQFLHYRGSRDASEEEVRGYNAQQMNLDESGEEQQLQISQSSLWLSSTYSTDYSQSILTIEQQLNDAPQNNPSRGDTHKLGGKLKFDFNPNQQDNQQMNQQDNQQQAPNNQVDTGEAVITNTGGNAGDDSSAEQYEPSNAGGPPFAHGNLQDTPNNQEIVFGVGGGSSGGGNAAAAGLNNEPVNQNQAGAAGATSSGEAPQTTGVEQNAAGGGAAEQNNAGGGAAEAESEEAGPAQQGGAAADSEEPPAGGALGGVVGASSEEVQSTAAAGSSAPPTAPASSASVPVASASPSQAMPVFDSSVLFSSSLESSSVTGTINPVTGVVALQEGEEAAIAPEPLTDTQKRNIGVGVGVGASAALAMAAGAVYYTKSKAAGAAASSA